MTDNLRSTIREALLAVARNVAKHLVGRDGWSEDDACFQVDLREAEDAVVGAVEKIMREGTKDGE